jgi:hypothetical protein
MAIFFIIFALYIAQYFLVEQWSPAALLHPPVLSVISVPISLSGLASRKSTDVTFRVDKKKKRRGEGGGTGIFSLSSCHYCDFVTVVKDQQSYIILSSKLFVIIARTT